MGTTLIEDRDTVLAKCRWIVDGGHEWLQVPLFAARVADQADKANGGDGISTFSFTKLSQAYLEGDCDAAVFVRYFGVTDGELEGLGSRALVIDGLAPVRDYPRWEA